MENCIICNGKIKDAGIQRRLLGEKGEKLCIHCATLIYTTNKTKSEKEHIIKMKEVNALKNATTTGEEAKVLIDELLEKKEFIEQNDFSSEQTDVKGKTFWTSLIKTFALVVLLVTAIIGAVIGGSLTRYSNDQMIFVIIGGIVGLVVGGISVALIMFAVEISENIAESVNVLNTINNNLCEKKTVE